MKRCGKYGLKVSWNVKWYGKYCRNARRIVKIYENMEKWQVELWKDMENMEEKVF